MSNAQPDFEKAMNLLSAVIEKSERDDRVEASKTGWDRPIDGDGWTTYHLKLVRGLLEEHKKDKPHTENF